MGVEGRDGEAEDQVPAVDGLAAWHVSHWVELFKQGILNCTAWYLYRTVNSLHLHFSVEARDTS